MSTEHFTDAGGFIDHGDASALFPTEDLSGETYQYRDAQLRLETVDSGDVLGVSPTGLASSYFLAKHPLTVVETDSLSPEVRSSMAEQADVDIGDFEVIRIGRKRGEIVDRSLAEF